MAIAIDARSSESRGNGSSLDIQRFMVRSCDLHFRVKTSGLLRQIANQFHWSRLPMLITYLVSHRHQHSLPQVILEMFGERCANYLVSFLMSVLHQTYSHPYYSVHI